MILEDRRAPGTLTTFLPILLGFCLLYLLSWPILFSYDLWIFADRSNFLNLDYMLAEHLRLGVDAYYAYGLLPVFIQHVLFAVFGRGYWPLMGCTIATLILMAAFWGSFVLRMPNRLLYLVAVIALTPILLWVNPNLPYSMVQLSMLFALLYLLKGRPEIALAIATIGCFSVPSLPLLLTALLALYIAVDWWAATNRSISLLASRLAPGIVTYLVLAAGLSAFFGLKSLMATALPLMGVKFYYGNGSSNVGFADLIRFLHPAGHSLKFYLGYYVGTPVTWWVISTISLVLLGALSVKTMVQSRRLDPRHAVVLFCAILQVIFACVAYRGNDQHVIYDPVTAAGIFVGISLFPVERLRNVILILFTCIGLIGQTVQAHHTVWAWRHTRSSSLTMNLYAEPQYNDELKEILQAASTQHLLMMSNPTGVHNYYPTIHSPNAWFLVSAQMFPSDRERVLANVRDADVVVQDIAHSPGFTDSDPGVQSQLRSMCLTDVTKDFQIWWRHPPASVTCKVNERVK